MNSGFKKWDERELIGICERKAKESQFLEFKRGDIIDSSRIKQIAEVVSAFANAGGGQVLFGIQEGEEHQAEKIEEGWKPSALKREWLGDVIISPVTPKVDFDNKTIRET